MRLGLTTLALIGVVAAKVEQYTLMQGKVGSGTEPTLKIEYMPKTKKFKMDCNLYNTQKVTIAFAPVRMADKVDYVIFNGATGKVEDWGVKQATAKTATKPATFKASKDAKQNLGSPSPKQKKTGSATMITYYRLLKTTDKNDAVIPCPYTSNWQWSVTDLKGVAKATGTFPIQLKADCSVLKKADHDMSKVIKSGAMQMGLATSAAAAAFVLSTL